MAKNDVKYLIGREKAREQKEALKKIFIVGVVLIILNNNLKNEN